MHKEESDRLYVSTPSALVSTSSMVVSILVVGLTTMTIGFFWGFKLKQFLKKPIQVMTFALFMGRGCGPRLLCPFCRLAFRVAHVAPLLSALILSCLPSFD